MLIKKYYKSPLANQIQDAYVRLLAIIDSVPLLARSLKNVRGTGGNVSIIDLIAYQIGWGMLLIGWYEAGLSGDMPEMPGDGFKKWDYKGIAFHFYKKYHFDGAALQLNAFHEVVIQILDFVEVEYESGRLDKIGIWPWCTIASGKQWPLSKWVRVNTLAPYKRAITLIKSTL